jgi:class 3 adenylate cyclase/tetratricopeptide (TPR) repeat protein
MPSEGIPIAADKELANMLQFLKGPVKHDLVTLQGLWLGHDPDAWSGDAEVYRLLGNRILKLGEPLLAFDVVAEGIKRHPRDVRLRQLLALALARSGAAGAANAVLAELYQEGRRDEETLGLLARTHKDLAAETTDTSGANQHMRQAYDFYTQAYQATGGYWTGINAATVAFLRGDRESATALARQVSEQCRQKLNEPTAGDRYWVLSTLGEAALLLGDWLEAEKWYGEAVGAGSGDWGSLQTTRHNARVLMQYLGSDLDRIEHLFRFPSVVAFTGHMIDRPQREVPRFPPQLEPAVKRAIQQRLRESGAGFGYASGACGSDILFHEAILEMKGEVHVILPYEKGLFIKTSVEIIPGSGWAKRYEKVMAQAVEFLEASKQREEGGSVSYEFANLMLHGLASVRAEQLETKLVPLAVWDGRSGDGPGGTAATVERWRELGLSVEIIDLREILLREGFQATAQSGALPQADATRVGGSSPDNSTEIRALLFADAEGFSKLNDEEVPRFVEHFLGLVGRLADEPRYKPLTKNTWGDGLYFVFTKVRDAGQFALDLRDRIRATDWAQKSLPNLSLRIGLHAGPVYSCIDPVTRRQSFFGAHVSRAARIEPITPTGQVYASQAFAALAAAEGVREFRCDYVGQTSMAKKYGTYPTYVVLRRRVSKH